MKAVGILSALFAGLNGVDDFQGVPQTKKSNARMPHSKTRRTKGAYDRSQRIRANRRKAKRCLTK
ncbi:hypothetical protein [Campylobacter showae]|uniref:hypothetical protein n=1 Tax=Campylobacter showae TaxID=204 RepID=UPI0028D5439E|nr:hypothetical protein [Campylobacter showae]